MGKCRATPALVLSESFQQEMRINTSAIPVYRRLELAKGALDLVDLAFAQPGAEERYQRWLSERRKKAMAEQTC